MVCPGAPKKKEYDFTDLADASMVELRERYKELVKDDSVELYEFLGFVRHIRLRGRPSQSEFAKIWEFLASEESSPEFIQKQLFTVPFLWD